MTQRFVSRQTLLLFQTDADGCLVIWAEHSGAVGDSQLTPCALLAKCGKAIKAWSCSGPSLGRRLWATGNPCFSASCYPWEFNLFQLSLAMLEVKKQPSLVWAPTPTCGPPSCLTSDLPDHYGLANDLDCGLILAPP